MTETPRPLKTPPLRFLRARRCLRVGAALAIAWTAAPLSALADTRAPGTPAGRVVIKYWDKWTGAEKEAMQVVVDDFNAQQNEIFVDFMSISDIVQKTLLATAGGIPPDLSGVWAANLVELADKNALLPLDDLARGTNVNRDRYLPVYWNMGVYKDRLWGVPSTPATTGLYWNKGLFRAAGLDPERPPRTIAELDEYARKLTKVEKGHITQIGFMPAEPRWWPFFWVTFFDGQLWDGGANLTLNAPANIRAFEWIASYPKRYGVPALQELSSGFGDFASPQDAFFSGRMAMVFQGVWLANYIRQYAPGMDFGAAPFPVLREGDPPVVFVDSDMVVIPRGSPHVKEAFTFLSFLSRQSSTEKLNLGQQKNSPLRDVSAAFFAEHKHPYIRLFQDLAESPRGVGQPKMSLWWEYRREIETVFQRVWLMEATPEEALGHANARMQKAWDTMRARQSLPESPGIAIVPFILIGLMIAGVVALAWRRRAAAVGGPGRRSIRANASLRTGLAFFLPWGIGLCAFLAYPLMASLVYSFCDYSVLTPPRWVGLANFADLLTDEVFWIALKNTLLYVVFALPLGLLFSFLAALMLDAGTRGTGIYRTLIFLPSLTPVVASAMTWLWIYNSQFGVLNHLLGKLSFGLIEPIPWLADTHTALPSLALMSFWSIGQVVVILLAAMQDVPTALYEAADLDGAGWWRKVWHITVPLTSPVIFFNAVIGIIGGLQLFTQPYLMTEGGPARATLTYTMSIYQNAFTFLRMGYASAMAWILFLVILGLTAAAIRVGRSRVHYS